MVKMKVLITSLIFVIVLMGCKPMGASPRGVGYPNPNSVGYPNPVIQDQSSAFPSILPTPIASEGTVIGTLISTTPGGALAGLALYFGTLLPLTPGPDHLVTMDIANSPKTVIRDNGSFMVENIPPGEYVLILWTPHEARYVPDPDDSEKDFIVEVIGGQIVDIGTLQAPSPP